jgi:hypothetical protein
MPLLLLPPWDSLGRQISHSALRFVEEIVSKLLTNDASYKERRDIVPEKFKFSDLTIYLKSVEMQTSKLLISIGNLCHQP